MPKKSTQGKEDKKELWEPCEKFVDWQQCACYAVMLPSA